MNDKPLYQVWRRSRTGSAWQKWGEPVPSKAEAYNTASFAELQASEERWEYNVQEDGKYPPDEYGQTYQNRMMRTRQ